MARRDAGLIDAGDPGPQPLYGLPPPDGGVRPRPDAGFDPDAADASPIQPLYGLPPPRDAG
jgi:hypothetical protein